MVNASYDIGAENTVAIQSRRERAMAFMARHRGGLARLTFFTLVGTGLGFVAGAESRDDDVARAERIGNIRSGMASALGNAGFKGVVQVDVPEQGYLRALLSIDPKDPAACSVAFEAVPKPEGLQLELNKRDSANRHYATRIATNNGVAQSILRDECST